MSSDILREAVGTKRNVSQLVASGEHLELSDSIDECINDNGNVSSPKSKRKQKKKKRKTEKDWMLQSNKNRF